MAKNLTKLMTNCRSRKLSKHQAGQVPLQKKKSTPRHIIFELNKTKTKWENLKRKNKNKEKHLTYNGTKNYILPIKEQKNYNRLLIRSHEGRREWSEIFKVLNERKTTK